MLSGTYIGYAKATEEWWVPINRLLETRGLSDRPVYFVSSNTPLDSQPAQRHDTAVSRRD